MTERPANVPPPGVHPDLGLLAAHAERRLSGAEAARIDEHLASCSTCYAVFAETARFGLDEEEVDQEPVVPLVRRLAHSRPLQLAAVLLVAIGGAWGFQKLRQAPSGASRPMVAEGPRTLAAAVPGSVVAELAEAMGTRRFVEPRLTGGFRYGRFIRLRGDTPQGLDAQSPAVLAAVARIREQAQADTSPAVLGALGITYLVSGDVGAAVKALESATAQAPESSRLQSDLSAAYLVRASRLDEPADIPKGLEAAEKAVALKDAPTEAWFNRALALESLHLTDAARKAWDDYLKHDPSSPWAEEARRHLADLPATKQSTVEEDRARVRAALDEGPTAVNHLADESPAMLREYFDNELLSAWAEALLADRPEARALRERAQLVGKALLRTTGDALPRDAALAMAPSGPSRDPPRTQALGYRALRHALTLYEQQPSAACPVFREARRLLLSGGSPHAEWTRERVVSSCLYPLQPGPALAELARIEVVAEQHSYVQLLGRVRWMQGLIRAQHGEMTASLLRYELARGSFHQLGDADSETFLSALTSEVLGHLGERRRAWRGRTASLALLDRVRTPRRRHGILEETTLACLSERLLRSALQVQTTLVEADERAAKPALTADALTRRSVVLQALSLDREAAADLAATRRWIQRIGDDSLAERLNAEVDAAEGLVLGRRHADRAAESLGRALGYFQRAAPYRVPALRLDLSRAQASRGLEDAAEAELQAGISLLEAQRLLLRDAPFQASFFEQSVHLFDDMVALQVDRRRDPERALSFVERGRARELADSLISTRPLQGAAGGSSVPASPTWAEPGVLRRELPDGLALVYHVRLDDRLLVWVLRREGVQFATHALREGDLLKLVSAHRAALDERASLDAVRETGGRLYDELVRPIVPNLESAKALVFVPGPALGNVPFASLWDRDTRRYLVEAYLLGLSPSGTLFVRARNAASSFGPSTAPALIVGNPRVDARVWRGLADLPGAEAEAAEIARLYPGAVLLTGKAATKAAFLRELPKSRVVHYAGHAASSPEDPGTSRLLFAPDPDTGESGALFLHELPRRGLSRVRVVVLAACGTAAGAISRVEGPLSLSRPFLAAGVPDVVGGLWDVDDQVSRRFFVMFHQALRAEGDPARALQQTQLSLLRGAEPTLAHPASWAGFVNTGGLDLRRPPQ